MDTHTHTHTHTHTQLENADFMWKGLKKRMLNRREQLASLQQAEVRGEWVAVHAVVAGIWRSVRWGTDLG